MPTLKNQYAPRHALALIIALIAAAPMASANYTFTNFSVPGANGTLISGISGNIIYGEYTDANSVYHGFIMSNGQLTTLDAPQAGSGSQQGTVVHGISGNTIVGTVVDANNILHGFVDSAGIYSIFDAPGAGQAAGKGTSITGIDGQNEVGLYTNSSGSFGFLYNGSQFTTISDPLAPTQSWATGISGTTVVGTCLDAHGSNHGFVFDGSTYTTIDAPTPTGSLSVTTGTEIQAINGSRLIGAYFTSGVNGDASANGFIYDGSTYEGLDYPSAHATFLTGESGGTVVGYYYTSSGSTSQSFIATSPEPTAAGMLLFGGSFLALRRRKVRR